MSLVVVGWDCGKAGFNLCTPRAPDPVFPSRPVFGSVNHDPSSTAAIALVKKWLECCHTDHQECANTANAPLPTRTLDVQSSTLTGDIKLYCSKSEQATYLALSYCWGGIVPLHTTSHNLEDHKRSTPWTDLAPTFGDYARLARLLGVRYVWIDALCIIQDSAKDWDCQSAQMASIYSNTDLVLIAANAPSVSAGFLHLTQATASVGRRQSHGESERTDSRAPSRVCRAHLNDGPRREAGHF
ncbi:hypothetical protein DOTSEDRAFT_52936 [Dothistroma septosporum NZE10]|uniref:Heterokaryon incompatibility domain-containing protein n=1 Tax=Dothistroma septosporum (strain NZE10 / CBS 128990) TaxID=675120 RepID=N1PTQ0_DOTSN|nr:hypothetical protein DOTSEDRAFT_52936 [Dothistroma septosporum NZE10]